MIALLQGKPREDRTGRKRVVTLVSKFTKRHFKNRFCVSMLSCFAINCSLFGLVARESSLCITTEALQRWAVPNVRIDSAGWLANVLKWLHERCFQTDRSQFLTPCRCFQNDKRQILTPCRCFQTDRSQKLTLWRDVAFFQYDWRQFLAPCR